MLPLQVWVELGAMAMKEYYAFPKAPVSSDCLVSYPGYSLGKGSYSSAEMQSVYSLNLANRATSHYGRHLKHEGTH